MAPPARTSARPATRDEAHAERPSAPRNALTIAKTSTTGSIATTAPPSIAPSIAPWSRPPEDKPPPASMVVARSAVERGEIVERVVERLSSLTRKANLAIALEVGKLIFVDIYGGDLKALRDRGPKHDTFRSLAKHPRLPFSSVTLWRSVSLYELTQRFPGVVHAQHLGVAHLRAVLGLPHDTQERLIRFAEIERWSKDRVEREASVIRRREVRRTGRRPLPEAVKSLRALEGLASKGVLSPTPSDLDRIDDTTLENAEMVVRDVRAWCDAMTTEIARRAAQREPA